VGNSRKTVRESKAPERFCSYLVMVSSIRESEPSTFEEAADQQVKKDAMVEDYNSNMKNDVWEVVPRPEGKSVVTSRWLYKIKYICDGSIEKYKAQFVAQGFSQVEGVDYDETFALVARYTSISCFNLLSCFLFLFLFIFLTLTLQGSFQLKYTILFLMTWAVLHVVQGTFGC
jgi:hypothetical protein